MNGILSVSSFCEVCSAVSRSISNFDFDFDFSVDYFENNNF